MRPVALDVLWYKYGQCFVLTRIKVLLARIIGITSWSFGTFFYDYSALVHVSPRHRSCRNAPPESPLSSPPESPSHHVTTPPGSPWRSRLSNFKNAIVGSPRFHRKKIGHSKFELVSCTMSSEEKTANVYVMRGPIFVGNARDTRGERKRKRGRCIVNPVAPAL